MEIISVIKRLCSDVNVMSNGWCHFVYRHFHFVNVPNKSMIRITIPHIVNSTDYRRDVLDAAINETNREMKYIKVMVLHNGSVSLNYDHRIGNGENVGVIVEHIIKTLYMASEYLVLKLASK